MGNPYNQPPQRREGRRSQKFRVEGQKVKIEWVNESIANGGQCRLVKPVTLAGRTVSNHETETHWVGDGADLGVYPERLFIASVMEKLGVDLGYPYRSQGINESRDSYYAGPRLIR